MSEYMVQRDLTQRRWRCRWHYMVSFDDGGGVGGWAATNAWARRRAIRKGGTIKLPGWAIRKFDVYTVDALPDGRLIIEDPDGNITESEGHHLIIELQEPT